MGRTVSGGMEGRAAAALAVGDIVVAVLSLLALYLLGRRHGKASERNSAAVAALDHSGRHHGHNSDAMRRDVKSATIDELLETHSRKPNGEIRLYECRDCGLQWSNRSEEDEPTCPGGCGSERVFRL